MLQPQQQTQQFHKLTNQSTCIQNQQRSRLISNKHPSRVVFEMQNRTDHSMTVDYQKRSFALNFKPKKKDEKSTTSIGEDKKQNKELPDPRSYLRVLYDNLRSPYQWNIAYKLVLGVGQRLSSTTMYRVRSLLGIQQEERGFFANLFGSQK